MKILNLATTDMFGAGIAAQYLNQTFINQGFESLLMVKESKLSNKNVIVIQKYHSKFDFRYIKNKLFEGYLFHWLALKLKIFKNRFFFLNLKEKEEFINAQTILELLPYQPDIIILHWISGFVNMKTISIIQNKTGAKIFWIMMDNAPLTGGCHYPWDCNGFYSDCKKCKAIDSIFFKNLAYKNLKLKKKYLPKDISLICCSENDYLRANSSSLFQNAKIVKAILPVNSEVFYKRNKIESKQKFKISNSKKVIFYGSISVSDERKGFNHFVNAITKFKEIILDKNSKIEDFLIVVAGKTSEKTLNLLDIPVLNVGYLNEIDLAIAYNAADVYVSTSLEDSGPYMINQAIMCGTPVIAFEMGVAFDLVIDNHTGCLIQNFDSFEMAKGIDKILSLENEDYNLISKNCIELGKEKCGNFASSFIN